MATNSVSIHPSFEMIVLVTANKVLLLYSLLPSFHIARYFWFSSCQCWCQTRSFCLQSHPSVHILCMSWECGQYLGLVAASWHRSWIGHLNYWLLHKFNWCHWIISIHCACRLRYSTVAEGLMDHLRMSTHCFFPTYNIFWYKIGQMLFGECYRVGTAMTT